MECLHPQDNNHLTQLESNCIEHDFLGLLQRGKSASLMETYCAMDEKSATSSYAAYE